MKNDPVLYRLWTSSSKKKGDNNILLVPAAAAAVAAVAVKDMYTPEPPHHTNKQTT